MKLPRLLAEMADKGPPLVSSRPASQPACLSLSSACPQLGKHMFGASACSMFVIVVSCLLACLPACVLCVLACLHARASALPGTHATPCHENRHDTTQASEGDGLRGVGSCGGYLVPEHVSEIVFLADLRYPRIGRIAFVALPEGASEHPRMLNPPSHPPLRATALLASERPPSLGASPDWRPPGPSPAPRGERPSFSIWSRKP